MEKRDYAILSGIAVLAITVGGFATNQPLSEYLVSGTTETANTAVMMAWIIWWALVAGFAIAGGVEAWISTETVSELLEGHSLRELGYGTFFGFISSSCSYSAVATAKNFLKQGASAAAALGAYMFAATNLVIEIGIVIWLLLGWQFLLADFLGGLLLIGLMTVGFVYVVPDEMVGQAKQNAVGGREPTEQDPVCGIEVNPDETDHVVETDGGTHYFCSESCAESFDPEEANTTIKDSITSKQGWKRLADKQWKEWSMLWEDIAIGFVFAGILAGFVPDSAWTALFANEILGLPAFVVWTTILGAFIGVATFVCSVGNVLFATVLWTEGLSFGGVLSYIFADLIIPPLMDAYRGYYGGTFAAILSGIIFVAAVISGLVVYIVFASLDLIPPRAGTRIAEIAIELDYKAVLNVLATGLFVVLYYLHRDSSMDSGASGGQGSAAD
ncbi:permease [Halobacteriales archaeon QS_3_64_16]|nr:MAG: permease [Halobacteriales archaeon QS_3_64_16]